MSTTTVSDIVSRSEKAGLCWPLSEEIATDQALNRALYPERDDDNRPLPNWQALHIELKRRKGVTLQLLWHEYRQQYPHGYGYSRFCELYGEYIKQTDPVMRQTYQGGDKTFVDWAGDKLAFHEDGVRKECSLFVAALGASHYIFAQVYRDETMPNWLAAHMDCFEFYGGSTKFCIPDCPRTAVSSPCYYEPELNPTYAELLAHYGTIGLPARPNSPRDKAKVETGVLIAEREILAPLRHIQFQSFGEIRSRVATSVQALNARRFQKINTSRIDLFNQVDRPLLNPLPTSRFDGGRWSRNTVHQDYHISVDNHLYSVPHEHIGKTVEVRRTAQTLEIFLDRERIALHQVNHDEKKYATTLDEHRPHKHSAMIAQSRDTYVERAARIGESCARLVARMLDNFPHPEMGFRACEGILRLAGEFGAERLLQACAQCLELDICRYKNVVNMLRNNRDTKLPPPQIASPAHANVRGPEYYRPGKEA